jgi:hypothetical protein
LKTREERLEEKKMIREIATIVLILPFYIAALNVLLQLGAYLQRKR